MSYYNFTTELQQKVSIKKSKKQQGPCEVHSIIEYCINNKIL